MRIRIVFLFWLLSSLVEARPINLHVSVPINGINQWIHLKGTDDQAPVLLYLHGGPGNQAMSYADKFDGELQKHFVVVQWDQRESGKTTSQNPSDKPLTLALVVQDVYEMIGYLKERFGQNRIHLMGHSWGGFLALYVAATHPQLLKACYAISPMVNQEESERQTLSMMIDHARKDGNAGALAELAIVKIPFENADQLYNHRKWLAREMKAAAPVKMFVTTWAKKWLALFNEGSAVNFFEMAPEIRCPVYFFVGVRDYQTYYKLTEAYFKVAKAEKKDLFWFSNSAHNLNLTEPQRLQEIVISLQSKP